MSFFKITAQKIIFFLKNIKINFHEIQHNKQLILYKQKK